MKLINEATMFKILVEQNGLLLSITLKSRAFYFFLSHHFIGMKVAPTTDPFPGIVELSNYDIDAILRNWSRLSRVKVGNR